MCDTDPKTRDQRREALRERIRRDGGVSLEEYRKFFFDNDQEWQAELVSGALDQLEEVHLPWVNNTTVAVLRPKKPK